MLLGENTLLIEPVDRVPDDIRVGQIILDNRALNQILSQATLNLEVVDGGSVQCVPSRITITIDNGILQTVGAKSTTDSAQVLSLMRNNL